MMAPLMLLRSCTEQFIWRVSWISTSLDSMAFGCHTIASPKLVYKVMDIKLSLPVVNIPLCMHWHYKWKQTNKTTITLCTYKQTQSLDSTAHTHVHTHVHTHAHTHTHSWRQMEKDRDCNHYINLLKCCGSTHTLTSHWSITVQLMQEC